MLPGISRSGATISTSVLLGDDKAKAARFSFLMVVPLILGKIAKDFITGEISYESDNFTALSDWIYCSIFLRIIGLYMDDFISKKEQIDLTSLFTVL